MNSPISRLAIPRDSFGRKLPTSVSVPLALQSEVNPSQPPNPSPSPRRPRAAPSLLPRLGHRLAGGQHHARHGAAPDGPWPEGAPRGHAIRADRPGMRRTGGVAGGPEIAVLVSPARVWLHPIVPLATQAPGHYMIVRASRVGLTPSPTCLPGQGGSHKGDAAIWQRNGSREVVSPPPSNRWRALYRQALSIGGY